MTLSIMTHDELAFEETCRPRTLEAVDGLVADRNLTALALIFLRRKPLEDTPAAPGVMSIASTHAVTCDSAFEAMTVAVALMVAAGDGYAVHLISPSVIFPKGIGARVAGDLAVWTDDIPLLRPGVQPDDLRMRLAEHTQRCYTVAVERDWHSDGTVERTTITRPFAVDEGRLVWTSETWDMGPPARTAPTTILNRAAIYRDTMGLEEIRTRLQRLISRLGKLGAVTP